MRSPGPSPKTRALVRERDGQRCVRCGGTYLLQLHHRRPRSAGGSRAADTNLPSNLLLLDDACHRYVESHRAEALHLGLLVRQGQDPADTPVFYRSAWVTLSPDGGVTPTRRTA